MIGTHIMKIGQEVTETRAVGLGLPVSSRVHIGFHPKLRKQNFGSIYFPECFHWFYQTIRSNEFVNQVSHFFRMCKCIAPRTVRHCYTCSQNESVGCSCATRPSNNLYQLASCWRRLSRKVSSETTTSPRVGLVRNRPNFFFTTICKQSRDSWVSCAMLQ